jgi:hypothetical protein
LKNGVKINFEKTKYTIFHKERDRSSNSASLEKICIRNESIERVYSFKYVLKPPPLQTLRNKSPYERYNVYKLDVSTPINVKFVFHMPILVLCLDGAAVTPKKTYTTKKLASPAKRAAATTAKPTTKPKNSTSTSTHSPTSLPSTTKPPVTILTTAKPAAAASAEPKVADKRDASSAVATALPGVDIGAPKVDEKKSIPVEEQPPSK